MLDVITDTLVDALKLLPFLFVTYLIMEYIESNQFEGDGNLKEIFDNKAGAGTVTFDCLDSAAIKVYDLHKASSEYTGWGNTFDAFKMNCVLHCYSALSTPGVANPDRLYIHSSNDDLDYFAITGLMYEGYKLDTYVKFVPTDVTKDDDYVIYDVQIDVYGKDEHGVFGKHSIDRRLCSLHGSVYGSLD